MSEPFRNAYEDKVKADAYSKLEFPNSYYLAYRDLPGLISKHVKGRGAVDFGCGAGRSTRFLRRLGFETVGIDISADMIAKARGIDPGGDYQLIHDGDFSRLAKRHFDLVFSAFTFDNVPGRENRAKLMSGLGALLNPEGRMVLLDSTPEMYTREWASFSTKDFPENAHARSGERVRIITTDIEDRTPVEDILWFDTDYLESFEAAGLELLEKALPLGHKSEPYKWVNEMEISPWVIYVLKRK
ncbi:MAG: class I SAM-dependent methyltransferase [Euryarchaeota archaeon]|nr:class I SAM-dependent methyltransferase [Euryarchaeota archaeon]